MFGGGKLCNCGVGENLKFRCVGRSITRHRETGSWQEFCSDHLNIQYPTVHHTDGSIPSHRSCHVAKLEEGK